MLLGQKLLSGTMCTWFIDLSRNSSKIREWSIEVSLEPATAGKLVVLSYQLTSPFERQSKPHQRSLFGSSATEVLLRANYLEVRYSAGTSEAAYSGFALSWHPSDQSSSKDLLTLAISIVSVGVLVVICCCCCGICFYKLLHNIRANRYVIPIGGTSISHYLEVQRDPTAFMVSDDNRDTLMPKDKFRQELLEVGEAICTVCLEEFRVSSDVRKLPCKHLFHAKCIDEWLGAQGSQPNCPLCKQNPFQRVPRSFTHSQFSRSEVD